MTVAITGSSGFIGRSLSAAVSADGTSVVRLDRTAGVDLTDWSAVEKVDAFDLLVHLAGRSFVPDSFADPRGFFRDNFECTLSALELCRQRGAPMIFTSSYVYGHPEYLPVDESHPLRPLNPYSRSKLLCERLCEAYHEDFGVPVLIVRPFNVYGPNQPSSFLIPTIVDQAKQGRLALRDPDPRRDLLHIDDLVAAYRAIIDRGVEGLDVVNLGYGESHSVAEVVALVAEIRGPIRASYSGSTRRGEIAETVADISKAKEILGWRPRVSLREGLTRLLEG